MFRKMTNQQVYQSLFPMTNMGLYDQLKPVQNHQITITNNLENQPKVDESFVEIEGTQTCHYILDENKCDMGSRCICRKMKECIKSITINNCCDGCEECKCDGDTKCRCKNIKEFLDKLETQY
jgi:hypothetical protein